MASCIDTPDSRVDLLTFFNDDSSLCVCRFHAACMGIVYISGLIVVCIGGALCALPSWVSSVLKCIPLTSLDAISGRSLWFMAMSGHVFRFRCGYFGFRSVLFPVKRPQTQHACIHVPIYLFAHTKNGATIARMHEHEQLTKSAICISNLFGALSFAFAHARTLA